MERLENELVVIEMIKSVSQTIKAVRFSLLVCVIACALTFISAYNTEPTGWYTIRQKQYEYMDELYNKGDSVHSRISIEAAIQADFQRRDSLDEYKQNTIDYLLEVDPNTKRPRWQTEVNKTCQNTSTLMTQRRFDSIYTINVHWFGVHFDINDLGIIAGFFIIIFMLMLLYNLGLRYSNLLKLFNVLGKIEDIEERKLYFDLSTFSIILKLPKRQSSESSSFILNLIPYLLFAIPTAVYCYIFWTDLHSIGVVQKLFPGIINVIILEGIILTIVVNMTISIFKLDHSTDKLWDEFENEYINPKK